MFSNILATPVILEICFSCIKSPLKYYGVCRWHNRNLKCRNFKYFPLLSANIRLQTRNNYRLAATEATAFKNVRKVMFMIETFSLLYLNRENIPPLKMAVEVEWGLCRKVKLHIPEIFCLLSRSNLSKSHTEKSPRNLIYIYGILGNIMLFRKLAYLININKVNRNIIHYICNSCFWT